MSLDEQTHLAKIDAGQIGDWMGPMTMDYPVPDKSDWQKLAAGQAIDGTVHVKGDEFWVANVKTAAPTPASK